MTQRPLPLGMKEQVGTFQRLDWRRENLVYTGMEVKLLSQVLLSPSPIPGIGLRLNIYHKYLGQ